MVGWGRKDVKDSKDPKDSKDSKDKDIPGKGLSFVL
jgi:hypothetical protein